MSSKKRSISIAIAAGLLAIAAATSAGAFGRGHPGGAPGLAMLESRLERLDLSADVRAKAFAIIDASRGEERTLREKARTAHEQLRKTITSGAADTRQLDTQIDAIGALQTQQHKQFLHALVKIGALLPEDQR